MEFEKLGREPELVGDELVIQQRLEFGKTVRWEGNEWFIFPTDLYPLQYRYSAVDWLKDWLDTNVPTFDRRDEWMVRTDGTSNQIVVKYKTQWPLKKLATHADSNVVENVPHEPPAPPEKAHR